MPATADAPDAPAPVPVPSGRRWLWRSRRDRYLAGVAGGVGERQAFDPFFVRIALVIATLLLASADAPPLAAIAYVAAWLVVPEAGRRSVVARLRNDGDARREAAVAVLLLGATAVLLPRLGPGGSAGLRLGVALFGLAVLLLTTRPHQHEDVPSSSEPGEPSLAHTGPVAGPPPPEQTEPPRQWTAGARLGLGGAWPGPRRPRRDPALWPLTLSALVLYAVVCVIADQLLDPGLNPGMAVSGALLIVGAVLVISTWRGRARSAILVGVALVPLWVGFTLTGIDRYPGIGHHIHRPTTVESATEGFELGYGRTIVDLRGIPLRPGGELRTTVALTAGTARIRVPADARLEVTGDVGLGSISVNRYSRWDASDEAVVNRTLDRSYRPIPHTCTRQPVAENGLVFTNGQFPTAAALDDELRRRGWPTTETTTPPSRGEPGEWVLVGVDEQWQLCDVSAPTTPPDPATIALDVHLGIGNLEITREQPN